MCVGTFNFGTRKGFGKTLELVTRGWRFWFPARSQCNLKVGLEQQYLYENATKFGSFSSEF
jgi:hypothetical protein